MTRALNTQMLRALKLQRAQQMEDGGMPETLYDNRVQQERLAGWWAEGAPNIAEVCDVRISTSNGDRAIRIYRPEDARDEAGIMFLHGGGWARGSIATGEWACRAFAQESGLTVVSLAYSLAPENPFPSAINDICVAMDWCATHTDFLGFDGRRLILTGTSAGANLSLTTALARRDQGKHLPIGLGLLFGVYGDNLDTDSYRDFGPGQYGLSHDRMLQYFEWYVPKGECSRHPLISPINADLSGLPEIYLGIAEFDVLRDDSFSLAGRLAAANIPTTVRHFKDLSHGYAFYAKEVPAVRTALSDTAKFFTEVASARLEPEARR